MQYTAVIAEEEGSPEVDSVGGSGLYETIKKAVDTLSRNRECKYAEINEDESGDVVAIVKIL